MVNKWPQIKCPQIYSALIDFIVCDRRLFECIGWWGEMFRAFLSHKLTGKSIPGTGKGVQGHHQETFDLYYASTLAILSPQTMCNWSLFINQNCWWNEYETNGMQLWPNEKQSSDGIYYGQQQHETGNCRVCVCVWCWMSTMSEFTECCVCLFVWCFYNVFVNAKMNCEWFEDDSGMGWMVWMGFGVQSTKEMNALILLTSLFTIFIVYIPFHRFLIALNSSLTLDLIYNFFFVCFWFCWSKKPN